MSPDRVTPPPGRWPPAVGALTTTRLPPGDAGRSSLGWNLASHVGDEPEAVVANRRELAEATGVSRIQWLEQVHGARCVAATPASVSRVPQADAAWTAEPGLGVAVLTADCVPVVLCDRAGTVVGVAHGGWRGLVAGVLEALVAALPVAGQELLAWIGPAIGPDAFEVGDDVIQAIAALDDGAALLDRCALPHPAPGKHFVDLFVLSGMLLERQGVEDVRGERLCTYHDPRFYSFRREGRTGRMVTLAWLRP
jgi:YfiH family protein